MLRNKYFWIALIIVIPFLVVWVTEGFGWAIATLVIMLMLFLFIGSGTRRRRRRYYYEDDDEEEIIERRPRSRNVPIVGGDTQVYPRQKTQCPECGGSGRVKWGSAASGMPLITRGAPGSSKYVRCPVCGGSGKL